MCQETGLLKLLFGCLIVILVISGCKKDDDKLIPFHLTPGASDIRLDTDTAGAAESYLPKIAISGSNIYTVWHDERNGNADIYFNYSTDEGITWQVSDTRLDTDTAGTSASENPQIAVSDSNVYVVWDDNRNGEKDIYLNYSTNSGATWQVSDMRINTDTAGGAVSFLPQIVASGSNIHVVWEDQRNGQKDIYLNYSSDSGATWQVSDIRLDTDTAGSALSLDPQVAAFGNNVYVVWWDYRNGYGYGDIYLNYSTDGGATWQASDIRLDTDVAGSGSSVDPEIVVYGSNIYVVWEDHRNGMGDIYLNYSSDGGATWQASDIRLDTDTPGVWSDAPKIAVSGSNVYVVWQDYRTDGFHSDIYLNYSTDGGATWLSSDIRLDTDTAGADDSTHPEIAAFNSSVYVVWHESRNNTSDIYLNYSTNGGVNWQSSDIRVDTDFTGFALSFYPEIAVSGTKVYVVWEDGRNGLRDIYFNYLK